MKQQDCECSYSSVGDLVLRCPNHQPVEVPLAIVRADLSAVEKDVIPARKQSDCVDCRYPNTSQLKWRLPETSFPVEQVRYL